MKAFADAMESATKAWKGKSEQEGLKDTTVSTKPDGALRGAVFIFQPRVSFNGCST